MKPAGAFSCTGRHTIAEIRRNVLQYDYIFLGYLKNTAEESVFNPDLRGEVLLNEKDQIIVIGEE